MVKKDTPAWLLLLASAVIDTFLVTIVKMQFNKFGDVDIRSVSGVIDSLLKFLQNPSAAIPIIILCLSPIIAFIALSRLQLSRVYPVLAALHLFFVEMFSFFLLDEPVSGKKAIGLCCLVFSIFLISSETRK